MSKGRNRTVSRRSDGRWENRRKDGKRASSLHWTQGEAESSARRLLSKQGGGDLTVKGRKGQTKRTVTVGTDNDRNPSRAGKH